MAKFRSIITVFFLMMSLGLWAQLHGRPFIKKYTSLEYKGNARNFDLWCGDNGRVYVANFEGLLIYDGAEWQMIHTPGISRVTSIFNGNDSRVWFGGNNVLGYIEDEYAETITIKYVQRDDEIKVNFGEIENIFEDSKGKIHFTSSTYPDKSYCVENGTIKVDAVKTDMDKPWEYWDESGMNVLDRTEMKDQHLNVIATAKHGLIIKDTNGKTLYTLNTEKGLCSNSITAVDYDEQGSLWGATDNGIFVVNFSPIYTQYTEIDGLIGQVTSALYCNDNLFVGTLQGLYMLDSNDKFRRLGDIDMAGWQLVKGPGNSILCATAQGVYQYTNVLRQITTSHTLSLIPENTKTFLLGELDGIYRCTYSGSRTLLDESIQNVQKFERDENGGIWAITLYRKTYYKAPNSENFVEKENKKLSLLFEYYDAQNNKWSSASNGRGLIKKGLSDNQKIWLNALYNYNIQAMTMDGNIAWVGGNFGIIRFDLAKMNAIRPYVPQVYIRNFVANDDYVSFSITCNLKNPIGTTKYSYRMHTDDEWSKWSTTQNIIFDHLAHGSYEVTVRCVDAMGVMSVSDTITFEVPVPLYLKWYSIVIYILFLLYITYLIFRWRMHRAKQVQIKLEKLVEKRTRELKDAQNQLIRQEREATVGKLTKGLIDRILNPMNYINNFSHLTLGLVKDLYKDIFDEKEHMNEDNYEDSMDVLDMMKTNLEKIEQHGISTTRILKSMEELLKERSIKIESVAIGTLCSQNIEMMKKYYAEDIAKYNIKIEWLAPADPVAADVNATNLSKVFQAILANAMYAVKKKIEKDDKSGYEPYIKVSINSSQVNASPMIVFYDNGIGIEETIIDKVFDPFFTTKPTGEASGVGLYLCHQIIQDFGGSIKIESEKDNHTEITIVLP